MTKEDMKKPKFILMLCLALIVISGIGYAAMEKVSANPAFCKSCHNMQSHYDSYAEGDLLAKKHADADVTCHDCHEPSMAQQMDEGIKFITGNYKDPLPKHEYGNEQCLKCHDFAQVKEKTAQYGGENPHDSVHGEGNETPQCYQCHSVHQKQSPDKCMSCHPVDWDLDSSWAKK